MSRSTTSDRRASRGRRLGEYVFSGRTDMLETEAELARLEEAMSSGEPDEETLAAYSAAQQRFDHGGGYRWRDGVLEVLRGLGFDEAAAERAISTFSGGELTRASLARVLAVAARPAAARRADQPSRHPLPGVARGATFRGSTPPSSSSPTTAGSWRRSAPRCWSWRRSAPASSPVPGTPGARSRRRGRWPSARRSTASRRRSSGWSASSSASATRRRRRSRRSRG